MSDILTVRDLKKIYGKKSPFVAVNGISFTLKEGEILGLLGPNGSGKTTTIQMLLGTLTATSGAISYFGKNFFLHRSEILQKVSFASTYTSLPFILTVEENLNCFGYLYGISNAWIKAKPLLERFGIISKRKTKVALLSAGQVTRLMIVKSFFIEPKIVLLDEPTASLDPDIAHDVCEFLLAERDRTGLSILFTSHKMEEASELCDRIIVLKNGEIIADDVPENLAKSASFYQLQLTIVDRIEQAVELTQEQGISFHLEHRTLTCSLEEKVIPNFLNLLMRADVTYANIQIKEPTLEDYFLKLVGRERKR